MASSDRTDKSMTQKDGCWFTAQPDPTSMECDKLLELGISPEHSSSKSIVFGSSFHKSHPCFKGRSDSSGQLRSHSEETHDPAALICMRENLQNTPSMSSYSCSSGFSLPYSPSVPHHLHSSFKVQNPTVNLPQTCSDLSPSADVDSNLTSHAPAVPPPMALINVNRLSGQNFSSSLLTSNKLDISDHRPCSVKTKPQQTLLSLRTASNVNLGSADSLTSSGTSSWFGCGNTGGSEEHTKTESFLLSGSEALESRYVDTSARDSGLSSHSSNSTNVPINLTHCDRKVPTKTPKSSSPPPVPPHAPNSRAAASLAAKSKQDPAKSKSDTRPASKALQHDSVCRIEGLTIRLSQNFSLPKEQSKADDDRSNLINLRRHRGSETNSNSPVWIRKQNGSLNTHTDKPVHSSTQSCTVDPTHSSAPPRSRSRPPGVRSSMVESHSEPSLCIPCIAAKHYYLCLPPDIRTLIGPRVLKCIESGLLQVNPRNCKDCRRHVYAVGIDLFNRNPLRGLAFLERYKFLNVSCPEEVARFIASTPGLCRSRIGTFLGLPPSKNVDPTKVMHCLLQGLDFSNLEVDEALRLAVRHFGMPIESQEIDRYLQCLAECYYISRWPPLREGGVKINVAPVDMNQLLLLFYSVLLLQTSFHNENAAKSTMGKQTINMFLKNTHSFLFPNPSSDPQTEVNPNRRSSSTQDLHSDTASLEKLAARKEAFSNAKLTAIFQRIKAVPIVTGVDHTSLVQRISRALVVPPVHSECKHKQCGCCGLCESFLGLVEPHRRLVCYCTMVQFVRQHGRPNKVGVPRHVFLFNDLILLTKHAHSKRGESKRNLTGRQQDRLRDAIVCLLRGATETNESKQLDRLLAFYLHPPIDLLIQTPSQHESRRRNQRSEEYTTPNHRARPVSLERPANSCSLKSDVKVRSRSTCQRTIPSRLIGLRCVSLVGCAVKLFQTLDCRFGLEIWKNETVLSTSRNSQDSEDCPVGAHSTHSKPSKRWRLIITLAALTQPDFENILFDLVTCLRETNAVHAELVKFSAPVEP